MLLPSHSRAGGNPANRQKSAPVFAGVIRKREENKPGSLKLKKSALGVNFGLSHILAS